MFARFMPQEGKFFDLFNAHAEQIVLGAQKLVTLMDQLGGDARTIEATVQSIESAEHRADSLTHDTVILLNKTFITPLDRNEIHQLINSMDDIVDVVHSIAQTITMYDVRRATPDMKQLSEISLSAVDRVRAAVGLLHEPGKHAQDILKTCKDIDKLEGDADRVMRGAISRLFRDEQDVRELIKHKAIYELLETITDRCMSVANTVEGIVLENA
ncbi:DUF47 domain-containing protein [Chitinivorax sp. PXF-14]|uniref:DUF47 domain-containing protein n=1 Tax=Chitinivorax sp. PXF-14 TaxID=3230488 RepID=UPI0034677DCA